MSIVRLKANEIETRAANGTDAADLTIDCGTGKTPVLAVTVYNDANVGGTALRPGVTTPPVTQWVDNTGANTGIYGSMIIITKKGLMAEWIEARSV